MQTFSVICLMTHMEYNGHAPVEMRFCMTMKEPNTRVLRSKTYPHVSKEYSFVPSLLFIQSYPPLGSCTVSLIRRMLFVVQAATVWLHMHTACSSHVTLELLAMTSPVVVFN